MIKLPVQETFQSTIQGEGFHTGALVDFIRLYGCPVSCHFCDTNYADGGKNNPRSHISIPNLISELKSPRVVISGGEPFIHKQLADLVQAIIDSDRLVSIETSGAFYQDMCDAAWITLSPKEHISPQYPVASKMWSQANEVKIVVSNGTELDYYREHLDKKSCPIYLQPEWTQRDRTIPLTLELIKQYPIAKLSLQTHKYINVK